jgi:poly-beta-hydroxyalkanoate depolymerase
MRAHALTGRLGRLHHQLGHGGDVGCGQILFLRGQTQAAHGLCPNIPDDRKELYIQPGVGHYGVFNGRRFKEEIFPRVAAFIRRTDPDFAS